MLYQFFMTIIILILISIVIIIITTIINGSLFDIHFIQRHPTANKDVMKN